MTTETGRKLERWVADAYRAMGAWRVEHDVELGGNQIDVYVKMETLDRGRHYIAVEVKDHAQAVGVGIVNDFVSIAGLLRNNGLIDEGVIVSARGFIRPAKKAAETHRIRLLERADLEAMVKEAKEAKRTPPIATVPSFSVPYTRNPDFVGREKYLERLHQALMGDQLVGLTGMGGIGKTQLAVEYCHHHRDDYPNGIFWLDAINPLLQEFAILGEILGRANPDAPREQAARAAWNYLDDHPNALVVFDNIENPAVLNVPFAYGLLAANLRCRVLFTTRRRDLGRFQAIEVTVLPEDAALQLLLHHPSRRPILDPAHLEYDEARTICAILGYLPLALEIAGAHLSRRPEAPLAAYRQELLQRGALPALDDPRGRLRPEDLPTRHKAAVTATLASQWDDLRSDDARLLLRVAGQLPTATLIPTAHLGLLAGLSDREEGFFGSPLTLALQEVEDASLVEELWGGQVRLHPLVHEFAAHLTPEDEREGFRIELANNVINSLEDPARRNERAIIAGECLLGLEWDGEPVKKMCPAVLDALRELVRREQIPEMRRRTAAFLLTRLRWLDDVQEVSPDGMLIYLELIARYVVASADRRYLEQRIAAMLDSKSVTLSDRQRPQLLVHRAIMLGSLRELDEAARAYEDASQLISTFTGLEASLPEDQKLSARVSFGLANIARFRAKKLTKPEDQDRRREGLERAVELYLGASKLAQAYEQDVILRANIYKELSFTYAFLQEWPEAEECYLMALEILEKGKERVEDPATYVSHRAQVLEAASHVHWEKGQSLAFQKNNSQALTEYETAYKLAQKEIERLKESVGESRTLIFAHLNSAEYLLAMSECPGCDVSQAMVEACANWRTAQDMSRRLGFSELEQAATKCLDRYCPTGES